MPIKILRDINIKNLHKFIPTSLRGKIQGIPLDETKKIDLLIFSQECILSGKVKKVISNLSTNNTILAIGSCFTKEAIDLLKLHGITFVASSDFYWTDASYLHIKNGDRKLKK